MACWNLPAFTFMQLMMRYFSGCDSAAAGGADRPDGIIVPPRKQTTPTVTRTISLLFIFPSSYFFVVACDLPQNDYPKDWPVRQSTSRRRRMQSAGDGYLF